MIKVATDGQCGRLYQQTRMPVA